MNGEFDLTLALVSPELDQEELDRARRSLMRDLNELDGLTESSVVREEGAEGMKGGPAEVGAIMVSLASAGVFRGLIDCIKLWLTRDDRRRVQLVAEVEGNTICIDSAQFSQQEVTDLVAAVTASLRE